MAFITADLSTYQYKMCLHCEPRYIQKYQLVSTPEGYEYIKDILDYVPLWTEDQPIMTGECLHKLLLSLAGVFDTCSDYMLEINRVQLSEDSFGLQDSGDVVFTYMPFEREENQGIRRSLEVWLGMIHQHIDMTHEGTVAMLHGLSIALAPEAFDEKSVASNIRRMIGVSYENH